MKIPVMLKESSITRNLLFSITLTLIVTAVLILSMNFLLSLNKAEQELRISLEEYGNDLKQVMSSPLWIFDKETIQTIGKTYSLNPSVTEIAVQNEKGILFHSKRKNVSPDISGTYDIVFDNRRIGSVRISMSLEHHKAEQLRLFRSNSMMILVMTGILFFVIILLLQRFIRRPIQHFIRMTDAFAAGNRNAFDEPAAYAEFLPLVNVLQAMGDKITRQVQSIQEMNEDLEKRVLMRTSELRDANVQLKAAKDSAEAANKKIMDSINYAKLIQSSLLANLDVVKTYLPDSFFIWEPRDIVGGDIFYTESFEHGFIVAVIDCTGHGVPGAFMTMIAVSALKRIVKDEGCHNPAEILKRLNFIVKTTLHQDKEYAVSDDGMDVGIISCSLPVNHDNQALKGDNQQILTFAGAKIHLHYVHNGEIYVIKGDRQNIGYKRSDLNFNFTNHKINIEKGMNFYMATDGFADQLGGEKFQRFGSTRFNELLKQISTDFFDKQRSMLIQAFEEHRGNNDRQDDFTVIGFGF